MKLFFYKQQLHPCILRKVVESWVHSYYSDDVDIKFRAKGNSINIYMIWCVCIAKQLHNPLWEQKEWTSTGIHFTYILTPCVFLFFLFLACINPTKKFFNDGFKIFNIYILAYACFVYIICTVRAHFSVIKYSVENSHFFLYIYSGSWHA